MARRRQIIEMMVAEGQRQRRLTDKRMQKSIARLRQALEKELAELEGEIDDHVRGSPVWAEKEDLLASVPGVGSVIARTLIAELPELGELDRRKLPPLSASPPGPASPASGGQKLYRRRPKSRPRRLFMAAMVAARHNPVLNAFHDNLMAAGKPKIRRPHRRSSKVLTTLNAIMRDKRPWRSETA